VLSYTDQLNITVIADRDACPDLPTFTTGLTTCLSELIRATAADTPPAFAEMARLDAARRGDSARGGVQQEQDQR
jgi:hypothetical protein